MGMRCGELRPLTGGTSVRSVRTGGRGEGRKRKGRRRGYAAGEGGEEQVAGKGGRK